MLANLLQQTQSQQCVWSGKVLKQKFAIDHCMPFSRWPNKLVDKFWQAHILDTRSYRDDCDNEGF